VLFELKSGSRRHCSGHLMGHFVAILLFKHLWIGPVHFIVSVSL